MSWLFIDTSVPGTFRGGLLRKDVPLRSRNGRSGAVLAHLDRTVGRRGMAAVSGICVVEGPGSFSSIRTGVLLGNMLGRLLCKPLVGVGTDDAGDLDRLREGLEAGEWLAVPYVAPQYDREPNITVASSHVSA